ncbi:DUF3540 domain-containing protein [Serratia odorifera]|jgi:hypothetical protein|uniref:DUF3540 domain-containing protein n=2 Tax=Serratia odorifera TaxID=618 RepID=D4DZS6_SEROD|nr:DUF3540 domain-containing protein [Serratia odorifera]EFE96832.1 hypothetical protein HMPREF0758_1426 [Serratia odorifera DSM 4582]PNK91470.1 DUF3540 domain-containing protein [Serratia odorifera]RII72441.1 DUF3540 domain-containing protein [Serratia odorifera]VDZ55648.1 Protein of uncharacterised function (DUF3540) [Serratia odorifera]HEJ9096003.1 DUF3540 domain-containing protein [Serratia odorifera]
MNNINHRLVQAVTPPLQSAGVVTHCFANGSLSVESEGRGWHCQRAASCVIAPQVGDRVLVAGVDDRVWLLAVLERANSTAAELSVPGDLHIRSAGEISLSSETLRVSASQGDCHISDMQYSGDKLSAWVSLSRTVGKHAESVWQTITQVSHNLLRTTRQTEQVRAGQLDMQADGYARLHAQNTVITSTAITKVDAEQIHMG